MPWHRCLDLTMIKGVLLILLMIAYGVNTPASKTEDKGRMCLTAPVTEGETGQILFILPPGIDIVFMQNENISGNIIQCISESQASGVKCDVFDHRFHIEGLTSRELLIKIPDVSLGLQGVYELHIIANGAFEPTTSCHLTVNNKEPGENLSIYYYVLVCLLVMSIIWIMSIYCLRRRLSHMSNAGFWQNVASKMKAIFKPDEQQNNLPNLFVIEEHTLENEQEEVVKSSSEGKETSETDLEVASGNLRISMDRAAVKYINTPVLINDSSSEGRAKESQQDVENGENETEKDSLLPRHQQWSTATTSNRDVENGENETEKDSLLPRHQQWSTATTSNSPADIAEGNMEGKECAEENDGDVPNVSTQIQIHPV